MTPALSTSDFKHSIQRAVHSETSKNVASYSAYLFMLSTGVMIAIVAMFYVALNTLTWVHAASMPAGQHMTATGYIVKADDNSRIALARQAELPDFGRGLPN